MARYGLLVAFLSIAGCGVYRAPVVATPPTPAPRPAGLSLLGQSVQDAALPSGLLGSSVLAISNPPAGFSDVTFASTAGALPPGPGFLGFLTPTGQYVAVGLDPGGNLILDTTNQPYPVLTLKSPTEVQWIPALTRKALLAHQADGSWSVAVSFLTYYPWQESIDVFRNGLLQSPFQGGDIAGITYDGTTLKVTTTQPWSATDTVLIRWVHGR